MPLSLSKIMCVILCLLSSYTAYAIETSGKISAEFSYYPQEGQFLQQDYRTAAALAIAPEWYWQWNQGNSSVTFTPFIRIDERDSERSHEDIRELMWLYINGSWEFRAGVSKIFWGVTEFNHLVDIINQTDFVDSFDGEEKLGQPMLAASRVTRWGIIDILVLPYFRERTFSGQSGRLRGQLRIDTDNARYQSSREEKHIDSALRWSHSFGDIDIGAFWFKGTDRNPLLQLNNRRGEVILTPFYQQSSQLGIDLQLTRDSWLWKLEALHNNNDHHDYSASQVGFEYTLYGIAESTTDIGVLVEYGWDSRGIDANRIAQNDIYLGARLTLNDSSDTTLLTGLSYDADHHSRSLLIEASRRINDSWTIALEGIFFDADNTDDIIANFNDDSRLQLTLERYF